MNTTIVNPAEVLTLMDSDIERGENPWELAVGAAFTARESMDNYRWLLGDIAARICRKDDTPLRQFASAIKIERVSTLRSYLRVSKFFANVRRDAYPNLSWSHWRSSMRAKSVPAALSWLNRASANDWPVAKLDRELRKTYGDGDPVSLTVEDVTVRLFNPATRELTLVLPNIESTEEFVQQWKEKKPPIRLTLTQAA